MKVFILNIKTRASQCEIFICAPRCDVGMIRRGSTEETEKVGWGVGLVQSLLTPPSSSLCESFHVMMKRLRLIVVSRADWCPFSYQHRPVGAVTPEL